MTCIPILLASGLCLAHSPVQAESAPADDCKYYVLLYGGQAERNRPQTAHTWATFVKGTPYPAGGGAVAESFTISWLPVQMPVRPFKLSPEAGRNYSLTETLGLFDTGRSDLGLWGPFEIRADWYRAAANHKRLLDGGTVRFATFDRGSRRAAPETRHPDISHCVHALTRTWDPLGRATHPVNWYGELITRRVAEALGEVGLLVNPCATHDWVLRALGLEQYPTVRRRLGESVLKLLR